MTSAQVLAWLARRGRRRNVEGMARYGIRADHVFGVSMATMKPLAARLRPDHALALELWATGWYEARILAALIDDPARVTARQMQSWAAAFDNWAVCDTTCMHLFDKSPLAWAKAREWAGSPREFVKRAGFALMASLALLPIIERAASDDRNFVKKGVSWALRGIGHRNKALHRAAVAAARRLAVSSDPSRRWVGKDGLKDLLRFAPSDRLGGGGR
jgi:3-methyladenine DNA glycosylase AlkD